MPKPAIIAECISLLKALIATPSFSREEADTAALLTQFFEERQIPVFQEGHNIWVQSKVFSLNKPTILLNSHHDTVKPAQGWVQDPFTPVVKGSQLTGLGSNDAGGPLVSLIATFLHFYSLEELPFNLILAASAEEEISGSGGISALLPKLPDITAGIVGEPTQMQMAVAEKGLMVLECTAQGRTGHAARAEGINAIYEALPDLEWFRTYQFPEESEWLGPVKMTVTQIEAGFQHNVVPDTCKFVVDVRSTDCYSNRDIYEWVQRYVRCQVQPRSLRLNPSGIATDHPLVVSGSSLGLSSYGSPTLSDQALMPFPTLKLGPGDSARSHTPNEFILFEEIEEGINLYIKLLEGLSFN